MPEEEFRARVADVIAGSDWVVDGNYTSVRDLVWERADTVVWLDLPRRVVMRRVVGRTLRRMATGEELWNGNREAWRNLVRLDPDKSIIAWAWTQYARYQREYAAASIDPAHEHLAFIRLGSWQDVQRFLDTCRRA